jgi:hypothetical protein
MYALPPPNVWIVHVAVVFDVFNYLWLHDEFMITDILEISVYIFHQKNFLKFWWEFFGNKWNKISISIDIAVKNGMFVFHKFISA